MLLINVSPSWCFYVSFQCKIVSLDKLCAQIKHRIVFYIFELIMNICVWWCQLPHPVMVSVIVVYKNKATNAASKLL